MERKEVHIRKPHKSKTKTNENEEAPRRRSEYHKDCYDENTATEKRIRYKKEEGDKSSRGKKMRDVEEEIEAKKKEERNNGKQPPRRRSSLKEETRATTEKQPGRRSKRVEGTRSDETLNEETRATTEKTHMRRSEHRTKRVEGTRSDETVEGKQRRRLSHGLHRRDERDKGSKEHGDRKNERRRQKDKVYKECMSKADRQCYSDSELDQTRANVTKGVCTKAESRLFDDETKSIDISAMYNLFYQQETQNRKQKQQAADVDKKDVKKRSKTKTESTSAAAAATPCGGDQANVRGKLIRVLFKKVKELLKETEKLRDERKEFVGQIEELSRQVAGLKTRELEHAGMEMQIKDRLSSIANDDNITNKGTTFRGEVQSILNDIQAKYVTHWQNHERNMQQVQTHAESQIQTLMSSIVGKYVKQSEHGSGGGGGSTPRRNSIAGSISDRPRARDDDSYMSSRTKDDMYDFSLRYMKPLYVDTGPENVANTAPPRPNRIPEFSSSTLDSTLNQQHLLKIVDSRSSTPQQNVQRKSDQRTKDIDQMLHIGGPTARNGNQTVLRVEGHATKAIDHRLQIRGQTTRGIDQSFKTGSQTTRDIDQMVRIGGQTTRDIDQMLQTGENTTEVIDQQDKYPSKENLKEFWRHKLLQPNPLDTIHKDNKKDAEKTARNGNKSRYVSRNQY